MKRIFIFFLVLAVVSALPYHDDDEEDDDSSSWHSPVKSWLSKKPHESSKTSSRISKLKHKSPWKRDNDDEEDDSDVGDGAIVLFEKAAKRHSLKSKKNSKNRKNRKSLVSKTSGSHFSGPSPRFYDRGYDEFPFEDSFDSEPYRFGHHGYGRDFGDYGLDYGHQNGFGRNHGEYGFENSHHFSGSPFHGMEYGHEPYEGFGYGNGDYGMGFGYEPYERNYNNEFSDYNYEDFYQPRHTGYGSHQFYNEFDYPMGNDYLYQNNYLDRGYDGGYDDFDYPMNDFRGGYEQFPRHGGYRNPMPYNYY